MYLTNSGMFKKYLNGIAINSSIINDIPSKIAIILKFFNAFDLIELIFLIALNSFYFAPMISY